MEVLKVSSKSAPNSVAGAIAGVIREFGCVEVQAVGAGAANQAIKAVAVARGYLAPAGVDLVCIPAFANVEIDGENRTAIKLIVEPRQQQKTQGGTVQGKIFRAGIAFACMLWKISRILW